MGSRAASRIRFQVYIEPDIARCRMAAIIEWRFPDGRAR
jgi:hypothetical protein